MQAKIFIGYSNRLFADGLEALIKGFDDFEVMHTYPLGDALIKQSGLLDDIDALIIECDQPKRQEINLIHSLQDRYPGIRILLISYQPGLQIGMEILDSGISSYLLKACTSNDLQTALDKISQNKEYFCSDITKELISTSKKIHDEKQHELTNREVEVLSLLVDCQTSWEIAEKLQISENTVKTHKRNLQSKLGANNLLDMFMYALKNNIVDVRSTEFCSGCPYFNQN